MRLSKRPMKVVHYFYFPLNVGMWMGACLGAEGPRSLVETIDPGLVAVGLGWSSIYWMRQNPGPGIVAVRLLSSSVGNFRVDPFSVGCGLT